jgi:hypothetical protein
VFCKYQWIKNTIQRNYSSLINNITFKHNYVTLTCQVADRFIKLDLTFTIMLDEKHEIFLNKTATKTFRLLHEAHGENMLLSIAPVFE